MNWMSSLSHVLVMDMVFNVTFNNISAISWRLVLLVEETGVPRETHRPAASHWQTLSHNVKPSIEYTSSEWGSNSQPWWW